MPRSRFGTLGCDAPDLLINPATVAAAMGPAPLWTPRISYRTSRYAGSAHIGCWVCLHHVQSAQNWSSAFDATEEGHLSRFVAAR